MDDSGVTAGSYKELTPEGAAAVREAVEAVENGTVLDWEISARLLLAELRRAYKTMDDDGLAYAHLISRMIAVSDCWRDQPFAHDNRSQSEFREAVRGMGYLGSKLAEELDETVEWV